MPGADFENPTLASQYCRARGWGFAETFRHQYRITRGGAPITPEWQTRTLGGWRIEHCPALRSGEITGPDGALIAILLGIAIGPDGTCLEAQTELSAQDSADPQTWIEQLAGRFVLLAEFGDEMRLYCDPSGNLSTVYNACTGTIASSVTLAIEDELQPAHEVDLDAIAHRQQRLLFGQTTDQRVRRLIPNHYLRLADFAELRHWPCDDTDFAALNENRTGIYREAADRLARNVTALARRFSCALPITGGMDSRIVLASAAQVFADIDHYYCYGLNWSTEVDAKLAMKLAAHLTLPFQVFSRRAPLVKAAYTQDFVDEEYDRMRLRTGWCYRMRSDWGRFVAMSPRVDVVLRGTAAEMTRANKWDAADFGKPCTASVGLSKLTGQMPGAPRDAAQETRYRQLLGQYEAWMANLPEPAQARLYDIAHMELWLPAGPVLEFSAFTRDFFVNPYNDRRLMQITSAVAPRARRRTAMVRSIIRQNCSSLLDFPFRRAFAAETKGDAT